jgi:hypothetical protein
VLPFDKLRSRAEWGGGVPPFCYVLW